MSRKKNKNTEENLIEIVEEDNPINVEEILTKELNNIGIIKIIFLKRKKLWGKFIESGTEYNASLSLLNGMIENVDYKRVK